MTVDILTFSTKLRDSFTPHYFSQSYQDKLHFDASWNFVVYYAQKNQV